MWDIIIVSLCIAAAGGYALYRLFARPSCGCGGSSGNGSSCGCSSGNGSPCGEGPKPLAPERGSGCGTGCGCRK